MRSVLFVLAWGSVFAWTDQRTAWGQMFGRPATSNSQPSGVSLLDTVGASSVGSRYGANAATVGTLQGSERFLRRNRLGDGFIGSDLRDRRRFIGARPSTATATRPAVPTVQIERASPQSQANTPVHRRAGMYEPPLEIGFEYAGPMRQAVSVALAQHLRSSPALDPANRIEVLVEGTTATLRGEVASERDRVLAEQLALFEPGVYAVRNELRVRPHRAEEDGWRPSPRLRHPKEPSGGR